MKEIWIGGQYLEFVLIGGKGEYAAFISTLKMGLTKKKKKKWAYK